MDYHPFKARLNSYFMKYVGGKDRPTFYDVGQTVPALNQVTANYETIRRECEKVLAQRSDLPRYHEIDPHQKEISGTIDADKSWRVFMLYLLGYKPEANRAICPETCRILEGVPNLIQAFFSILDPGKNVPLHEGPYLGYLRYHLGLIVPKENPPTIYVNSQPYTWQEGKAVMFDDTWPHQIINNCAERRVVLIVDVFRPLPFLPSMVNKLVAKTLFSPFYARGLIRRATDKSEFFPTN